MSDLHNNLPGMAEALAVRQRIDAGLTWLRNHPQPRDFEAGRRRLTKLIVEHYLPALEQIAATDCRTLLQHRSDTKRRLNRGASVMGERAAARWVQLLAEFEVLTAALMLGAERHPRQPLVQLLGRMEAIEAAFRTVPAESPARVEAVA